MTPAPVELSQFANVKSAQLSLSVFFLVGLTIFSGRDQRQDHDESSREGCVRRSIGKQQDQR